MATKERASKRKRPEPAGVAALWSQGYAQREETAVGAARRLYPPLDEGVMRATIDLVHAAQAFVRAAEKTVHRPFGWSWAGFRVCFTLSAFGPLEARSIARLAGVTRQTTASVLATLERDGFVRRERLSTEDRRLITVSLTRAGERAVKAGCAAQNAFEACWLACLCREEQELLASLLQRVLSSLAPSGQSEPHGSGAASAAPEPRPAPD